MTELRQTLDFYTEVAKGNVSGHSAINKFGHNPLVPTTGADIWSGGGVYDFYPASAVSMEIISTSANDDGDPVGTGARTVIIYGLDDDLLEVNETITMNGLTAVQLTAHTYRRIYRAIVLTAGTVAANDGIISIRVSGGGTVAGLIAPDDGQTQMTHYTVPAGKTAYFLKGYVAMGNDNKNGVDATFQWLFRPNNGVTGAWSVKGQVTLVNIGNSSWIYEYAVPAGPIPEKSDIKIRVTEADEIVDGIGGYDLLLVDN